MKKIFTLLVLMLAVVSVQAKTDKLYATFGTPASNGTYADGTYTWKGTTNNLMTIFTFSKGELANYATLNLTLTNLSGGTFRVNIAWGTGNSDNMNISPSGGGYGSSGTKQITLKDINFPTGKSLADVTSIRIGGNTMSTGHTSESVEISAATTYLETAEYDAMTITTTIDKSSTYQTPMSWGNRSTSVTNNFGTELTASSSVLFGYSSNNDESHGYINVTGYDKATLKGTDNGGGGIRYLSTSNKVATIAEPTADISDISMIYSIKGRDGNASTKAITVNNIDFIKEYADNSTTAFNIAASTSSTVEYDRSFTVGQKSTICLPFALTESEVSAAGKFYTLKSAAGGKLAFDEVTTTEAYKPYIFVANTAQPFASLTGKAIPATAANNTTVGDYTFTGLLAATSDIAADNSGKTVYGWSTDGSFKKAGTGVSVNAFRAVIVANSGSAPSLSADFNDDNTTDIREVKSQEQSDVMYNLAGQRVAAGHKGLVIKNGKKYFVK